MKAMRFVSVFVLLVFFVVDPAQGASPSLGLVWPRGAQRGTEATWTFSGARLTDAKEIVFYSPGFTVAKLQVIEDANVRATVKIAADCKLGEHAVRVRTASGLTELRTVWVGALPVVDEKEPNSELAKAQKIGLNCTVHGVVDYEDVDYYAVECKKGQRLSVEIEGMRLGETLFDPFIAILDSKRFELATSDDSALNQQDGLCSVIVPADGTYYVMVRESAYQGNGACRYRLHVGDFPRPLAVVPAGGKAGEEIEVTFLGDPTGPIKQKVKVPDTPGETIRLHCEQGGKVSPSGIPFKVSAVGNVVRTDPKDATPATLPLAFNGVLGKDGETASFKFKGLKGQTFDIHCHARKLGSPLDPVMSLAVAGSGAFISNDDSGGPDSYFRYTFGDDREYVLTIADHLGKGGTAYFFRVEFTPVVPVATASIPKVA
ncbi:MAG: PPC domain-containing protein, partial [Gemmataceae bacterium]|nr:PPC domain-containing protein [Gemmataceae bacterium]